jgi:hypothetical protein
VVRDSEKRERVFTDDGKRSSTEDMKDLAGLLDKGQRKGTARRAAEADQEGADGLVLEKQLGLARREEAMEPRRRENVPHLFSSRVSERPVTHNARHTQSDVRC